MRSFYPLSPAVLRFTDIRSYLQLYKKERSRKRDLWLHLGIELGTSRTEGRALISRANPSSCKGSRAQKRHLLDLSTVINLRYLINSVDNTKC